MKLKYSTVLLVAALSSACALQGATIGGGGQVSAPAHAVGLTVRDAAGPVAGAMCGLDGATDSAKGPSNANGTIIFESVPLSLRATQLVCSAPGYQPFSEHRELTGADPEPSLVAMLMPVPPAHADPSIYTLGQRAAVRGAIFPRANVCAEAPLLPYGPRPFQPDNIIATTYFDNYTADQQEAIARCLKSVGFTHVAVGGLVDSFAYHGQYIGHDYSTDEGFERFLDQHQWFYDHGLIPVTFIHRDGATLAETQAMMRRLVAAHPRAQQLITIVIVSGWEPAKYEWSSCTWAGYVALGRELFPKALNGIHTVSDVDAPVGTDELCNDDDHTWNPGGNGAGWKRVIDAGLHAWFIQNGPYEAGPDDPNWTDKAREFAAQFKKDGDGALYHGVAWHFGGPGGWTGDSAFGPGVPICLIAAENTAYEGYWSNRPSEAARAAWGNLAVNSGACGYMDGGSVPVLVRR